MTPAAPRLDIGGARAWALEAGLAETSLAELLAGVSERLVAAGLRLSRTFLALPTIDREARALSVVWVPGGTAWLDRVSHARQPGAFEASPIAAMQRQGEWRRRWPLELPGGAGGITELERLAGEGHTEYMAQLVRFGCQDSTVLQGVALTCCTDRPGGFTADEADAMTALTKPLALAAFRIALLDITRDLLGSYIGADAAARVLNGQIQRGQGLRGQAVLMFADLKGFTSAAETRPEGLVARLGEHLAAMAEPVEAEGGEVLKFMGDGMLAAFPAEAPDTPEAGCRAALRAARAALRLNAEVNARRDPQDEALPLDVALHLGEVFYGNIGAGTRLDFTVIGPAVNQCSRIEALCDRLGTSLLLSSEFAARCGSPVRSLGIHVLRGIAEPREIFTLDETAGGGRP